MTPATAAATPAAAVLIPGLEPPMLEVSTQPSHRHGFGILSAQFLQTLTLHPAHSLNEAEQRRRWSPELRNCGHANDRQPVHFGCGSMLSFSASRAFSGLAVGIVTESRDGAGEVEREAAAVAFELGEVGRLGRSLSLLVLVDAAAESRAESCVAIGGKKGARDPWPSSALVLSASSMSGVANRPRSPSLGWLCQKSGTLDQFLAGRNSFNLSRESAMFSIDFCRLLRASFSDGKSRYPQMRILRPRRSCWRQSDCEQDLHLTFQCFDAWHSSQRLRGTGDGCFSWPSS